MRWASSISDAEFDAALEHTSEQLRGQLGGERADLLLAFPSRAHQQRWHELPHLLRERFPHASMVGCSAGGVLGDGRELEDSPGLALAAARLPGVEMAPFHLPAEHAPSPDPSEDAARARARWDAALGLDETLGEDEGGGDPHLLLFADPFTWSGPELLASLDRAYPRGVKIGGLCSGGTRQGDHRLFCQRSTHHRGMVGVALRGNLEIETVVAQGCRPIGAPMFVTRHERHVIFEIDGKPAVGALQQLLERLDPRERAQARRSLFLGVVMDPQRHAYGQGDFLIRNLIGVDPNSGAIAVAAELHPNAIVQFHVRDAEASALELRLLLTELRQAQRGRDSLGALMFSCLGRGRGLYGEPDHDSALLRELLGSQLPLAGFFCNGEIGPIAGQTYLHGYTSAIALFRAARLV